MNPAATRVREALRQSIDAERRLQEIDRLVGWLTTGYEEVVDPATRAVTLVPLDALRVGSLKVALDVHMKLFAKVVPDLKAVELTTEDLNALGGQQDKLVLATKLLSVWRTMQQEDAVPQLPFLQ